MSGPTVEYLQESEPGRYSLEEVYVKLVIQYPNHFLLSVCRELELFLDSLCLCFVRYPNQKQVILFDYQVVDHKILGKNLLLCFVAAALSYTMLPIVVIV